MEAAPPVNWAGFEVEAVAFVLMVTVDEPEGVEVLMVTVDEPEGVEALMVLLLTTEEEVDGFTVMEEG